MSRDPVRESVFARPSAPAPRVRLLGLGVYETRTAYAWPRHQHLEFEAIVPIRGRYSCTVGGAEVAVPVGEALLLQPRDWHQDRLARRAAAGRRERARVGIGRRGVARRGGRRARRADRAARARRRRARAPLPARRARQHRDRAWDFADAIASRRRPEMEAEDGLRAKALCLACYESAARGGAAVVYDDVLHGRVDEYQRPIDQRWGLMAGRAAAG